MTPQIPSNESIEQLIAEARAGSSETLGRLLEGCRQYLLLIANRELPDDLQPKLGASDLVQETFLKAQNAFASFSGRTQADLLRWLRQILVNNIRDAIRHYREAAMRDVGREIRLEQLGEPDPQQIGELISFKTPSWLLRMREQHKELHRLLDRLSDDYRDVIVLRNLEMLSFEEVGQLMNRSAEAARKLWSRALVALAREAGEEDVGEW